MCAWIFQVVSSFVLASRKAEYICHLSLYAACPTHNNTVVRQYKPWSLTLRHFSHCPLTPSAPLSDAHSLYSVAVPVTVPEERYV